MMESAYGIGVKNRYAIFLEEEEEDPLEIISKKEEEKSKAVRTAKAVDAKQITTVARSDLKDKERKTANALNALKTAPDAKPANALAANKTKKDGKQFADSGVNATKSKDSNKDSNRLNNNSRPPKPDRQLRNRDSNQSGESKANQHFGNNERPPRLPRSQPINSDQKDIDEFKNQRNRDDKQYTSGEFRRERNDSDRRGRGGRGDRNNGSRRGRFSSGGKRDMDRHSGSDKSGVKAVEKREGGGAHNWGKCNDFEEIGTIHGDPNDTAERSADENAIEAVDNQQEDVHALEVEVEKEETVEGPKEKTLDEWKREQEEKRVQPKFNLRKPGEGEDNTQWKKTFVLKKKIEDEEEDVEYEEIEVDEELTRKGRQKHLLDIEINFRDEGRDFSRRGDGRRGRGGSNRGERGGGNRGDRGDRDRGDRVDRGDRGDRGERGERGERSDRGERGERSDRDRGDRERGGGGRGRGDRTFDSRFRGRGFRARDAREQAAPKMDDFNDFPSLAAS